MDIRKPRRMPWVRVLAVLVLCALLSYGIAALTSKVINRKTFGTYKQLSIVNIQDLQVTAGGFVYYDGSTVSALNSKGSVKWSYMLGQDAAFEATDYGVAAWKGDTITLIEPDTGKTIYNGNMDDDIIGAYVGDKYTAILTGEDTDSTVILMENTGRQVNVIRLEHVTALDYGFFSNGTLLWIMVCDTNGTVPTCCIQTYKPGREIVGSITDTQQMMYAITFQQNNVLVAGEDYLKTFDYTGQEDTDKRRLIYGWYLAQSEGAADPMMVFVTESQNSAGAIRDVRIMTGNTDRVVRMPYDCLSVMAMGSTVYGFSKDGHLMTIGPNDKKASAYRTNLPIDSIYGLTKDGIAVVNYAGTVYLLSLV